MVKITQEIIQTTCNLYCFAGSLFKLSRKKSTDYASKQSSWKVLKKRIRAGLFKKSLQGN